MVEPTFLVGLAVAFVLGIILILRQSAPTPEKKEKKLKGSEKKQKSPKKQKGPQRNSLKKDKRPVDIKEWSGVDTAQKDAQEMLEFLKGKDPAEIAKQLNLGKPSKKKLAQQAKKMKAEDSASEDSASDAPLEEGFEKIEKKAKTEKKAKKEDGKKKEKKESKGERAFFKLEAEAKAEENKKKGGEGEGNERKRRERPDGERKEGEKREKREPREPREPRPEGERRENKDKPVRKPIPTVAPIVKYEQAELTDILDSITQDFDKPKQKVNRVSSIFSRIPRNIVVSILSRVEAKELVALSRVNHYFSGVARKESLWKDLLVRDFGIKDSGKYRNFRLAYKAEFKKKRAAAKRQKKEEERAAAVVSAESKEESSDKETEKEPKQTKQKKDNKKKKAEEQPTDAPAED